MARIINEIYTNGTWFGVEFREEILDSRFVGVGHSDDPDVIARFAGRAGFTVEGKPESESKPAKSKAKR